MDLLPMLLLASIGGGGGGGGGPAFILVFIGARIHYYCLSFAAKKKVAIPHSKWIDQKLLLAIN